MTPGDTWLELYRHVSPPVFKNTLTGFNVNLDCIIPVTTEFARSPVLERSENAELVQRLHHSMNYCTAEEWFLQDQSRYETLARAFLDCGTLTIGGQAGIAAVHLATLGIPEVICTAPCAGPATVRLLSNAGVCPLIFQRDPPGNLDAVHLVFEYQPGIIPLATGVQPRNNRFIVSPAHDKMSVLIPPDELDLFLARISSCQRAFLSGYQYLQSEEDFMVAADQLEQISTCNRDMRTHIECVSVTDRTVLTGLLHHIFPGADSIGLNEYELMLLLDCLSARHRGMVQNGVTSAPDLVNGAICICKHTGLQRLHLHTFGYYILVLDSCFRHTSDSLNSLLFASRTVAEMAGGAEAEISTEGTRALAQIAGRFDGELSTGTFFVEGYTVIVIPACTRRNISKTSGLGDILSATAFVADRF